MTPDAIRLAVAPSHVAPLRWAPRQSAGVAQVRQAAVLVPVLVPATGPLELLFIVRPLGTSKHAGQVAFPGGVADEEDDGPVATALREAEEEIGLPRSRPEVLGLLPAFPTHTGFLVRPVVALIHLEGGLDLTPSPAEVASTFRVSLPVLAAPENQRTMRSRWAPGLPEYPLWFWPFTPTPIWGATGHILATLFARLDT